MPIPTWSQIQRAVTEFFYPPDIGDSPEPVTRDEVSVLCAFSPGEDLSLHENRLYECAQELRARADYERARPILRSLFAHSSDSEMRLRAHQALQDSLGHDVTDVEGNILEEGGGTTLLWPFDWFRNFSDEDTAGTGLELSAFVLLGPLGWTLGNEIARVRSSRVHPQFFDRTFDHRASEAGADEPGQPE